MAEVLDQFVVPFGSRFGAMVFLAGQAILRSSTFRCVLFVRFRVCCFALLYVRCFCVSACVSVSCVVVGCVCVFLFCIASDVLLLSLLCLLLCLYFVFRVFLLFVLFCLLLCCVVVVFLVGGP